MNARTRILSLIPFLALFVAFSLYAQAPPKIRLESKLATDSTIFQLKVDPKLQVIPGKMFDVKIHVSQKSDWHIYSSTMSADGGLIPLSVTLPSTLTDYLELVSIKETGKLVSKYDSNFQVQTQSHYEPFDIIVKLKAKPNAPKSLPLQILVHFQTCNESVCNQPRWFAVPMEFLGAKPITLAVTNGTSDSVKLQKTDSSKALLSPAPSKPSTNGTVPATPKVHTESSDVVALASTSIWRFLLAAAGFGLLALLTPCVFPMVPITVSFFTKRNAGSKREATKDALLYAVGIIVTFVALGFILSLVAGPAGINKFAANPWANLVIATIFITFALNLFGLFEIGLPSGLLSSLNTAAQKTKSRTASVILMGFVFSLTSFTCTVPFVGTLMVAFSRGSWFVPLLGMVVFAFVFALPFFLLALFPSLMKSMPRSGGWMNSVKVVMGFLEIGAALKFLSNADLIWSWKFFSRDLVLASWIALAIITTLYLLGRFQLSHDTPVENVGAIRVLIAVFFLSCGVYLYTGFHGRPLGQLDAFLPPTEAENFSLTALERGNRQDTSPAAETWLTSYPEALRESKRTGKNIFVDFTGYTCTNCRAMEATVFSRPEVKDILSHFVLARLYTDNETPLNDSNRTLEESRFNTIALPFYVILSPDDKALSTFPGFTRDIEAFKSFLTLSQHSATPNVAMR